MAHPRRSHHPTVWSLVYVDRKEVSRFKTFDEYKLPLYPLVSLTLYEKDVAKAVSPSICRSTTCASMRARSPTRLNP